MWCALCFYAYTRLLCLFSIFFFQFYFSLVLHLTKSYSFLYARYINHLHICIIICCFFFVFLLDVKLLRLCFHFAFIFCFLFWLNVCLCAFILLLFNLYHTFIKRPTALLVFLKCNKLCTCHRNRQHTNAANQLIKYTILLCCGCLL